MSNPVVSTQSYTGTSSVLLLKYDYPRYIIGPRSIYSLAYLEFSLKLKDQDTL